MRDSQLSRYDARPDAGRSHFDDLQSDMVRQRTAVDEYTAQLVYATLSWKSNKTDHLHIDYASALHVTKVLRSILTLRCALGFETICTLFCSSRRSQWPNKGTCFGTVLRR